MAEPISPGCQALQRRSAGLNAPMERLAYLLGQQPPSGKVYPSSPRHGTEKEPNCTPAPDPTIERARLYTDGAARRGAAVKVAGPDLERRAAGAPAYLFSHYLITTRDPPRRAGVGARQRSYTKNLLAKDEWARGPLTRGRTNRRRPWRRGCRRRSEARQGPAGRR